MSRSSASRARAWLLGLALLALLLGLTLPGTPQGALTKRPVTSPTPGGPEAITEPSNAPIDGQAPPIEEDSLHIWLRDLEDTRFVWSVPGHPFDEVWPDQGDSRWDTAWFDLLETPDAIRSLSGPGTPFKGRRGAQVLQVALDEGFGAITQPTTPEEALVALYTAWVDAEVGYQQDRDAFEAEHLPDGLTVADLDLPDVRALYALPGQPVQDMGRLRALAGVALASWPDHPLADHARLAELRAARPYGVQPWDADAMADLLGQIDSPALREQGALSVTAVHEPTPALLDRVFEIDASTPDDAYRLTSWGTARSVALGDWARASAWAKRMREAVETVCAVDSANAESSCGFGSYQLRETTARLVALGHQEPKTWQEALSAAAWRCHLAAPAEPGTSRTSATWTGERWELASWDFPSPVTACLDSVATARVVPESPLRVRLTVETQD